MHSRGDNFCWVHTPAYCNLLIARVQYIDHLNEDAESGPEYVLEAPLFCKQRSFEREREVRAAIVPAFLPDESASALGGKIQLPTGGATSGVVTFTVTKDWVPDFGRMAPVLPEKGGIHVPVDIRMLMQRVVFSPCYPVWAVSALQNIVRQSGLLIQIEHSALPQEAIQSG